jgi:hypothetical protein
MTHFLYEFFFSGLNNDSNKKKQNLRYWYTYLSIEKPTLYMWIKKWL